MRDISSVYCSQCAQQLAPNAQSCSACGSRVSGAVQAPRISSAVDVQLPKRVPAYAPLF